MSEKKKIKNLKISIESHEILKKYCDKKGIKIYKFIENCKTYYHKSKLKYLERKLVYKSFITIIRQICNANNIIYTSQIKYDKSTYDIIYYIYL